MIGEGCVADGPVADFALIKPAPTPHGRAAQLALLRSELPPALALRWGPLLECMIAELHRRGRNKSPERLEFEEWYRAETAAGQKKGELVRAWSRTKMIDPGQLYRWVREL